MDLTAHLSVIFQRKWQVIAVSLLIALAVFGWRSSAPETYRAGALLNLAPARALQGETLNEEDTRFIGESYAALATTRPVVSAAIQRAGLDLTVAQADERLSVDASQPGYLQVDAIGPSPREATVLGQGLAEAVVAALNDRQAEQLTRQLAPVEGQLSAVEAQLGALSATDTRRRALELQYEALLQNVTETRLRPVDRLSVVTAARAEAAPISPRPKRDALLALITALVVNAELAVALSALGGRFTGANIAAEVARVTGLPVLAEVPQGGRNQENQVTEAFRTLRTNLQFVQGEADQRTLAIVGGEPGSGKSFVAERLAKSLARPGQPVLLLDGDLRNPSLHTRLGVEIGPGLADALAPPYELVRPAEVAGHRNLRVLPAGSPTVDPAALFSGKPFGRLLDRLRSSSWIVVDTPPLSLFADAAAVAQSCDATVLVIDVKRGRRREVQSMLESLGQVGVAPVGIVLNRVARVKDRSYGGYRDASRRRTLAPPSAE